MAAVLITGCGDSDTADPTTRADSADADSGAGGGAVSAERPSTDAIAYVLPDYLPEGWVLGHATERVSPIEFSDGREVPAVDYTAVWRPVDYAGASREDSTEAGDDAPQAWINVGSALYSDQRSPAELSEFDLTNADVVDEDGILTLRFRVDCCVVKLQSRTVDESELRRIAEGMYAVDKATWRSELGERLLVDGHD